MPDLRYTQWLSTLQLQDKTEVDASQDTKERYCRQPSTLEKILRRPTPPAALTKTGQYTKGAQVLTSEDCMQRLREKEEMKRKAAEEKQKKKEECERKRAEKVKERKSKQAGKLHFCLCSCWLEVLSIVYFVEIACLAKLVCSLVLKKI